MKPKNTATIIILTVFVYISMIIYSDAGKLMAALETFFWPYILAIFALTTANYLFRYLKWDYFLKKSGTHIPLKDNLYIFASGLSMIITPGKMGEIWKSWLIRDLDGTPLSKTIPVVIVERITDVTGLALLAVTGALYYNRGTDVILFFTAVVILFFAIISSEKTSGLIISVFEKKMSKHADNIKLMHSTLKTITTPKGIILMTILSAFAWSFECAGLYLAIRGFGLELGFLQSTFIFSLASLAGAISMLPGGLGVAEGTIIGLLQYFTLPQTESVGISLIFRACTLWFGALMGMAIHIAFRKKIKNQSKSKDIKISNTNIKR